MTKRISQLMDQPEHLVANLISKLEDKNGYPSHDVRLLAESVQKIRAKMSNLDLDPDDTTGEELYHALLVKFEADSNLFDVNFGAKTLDFDAKVAKALYLVAKSLELPRQWALKSTIAKNVLRQHPPKRVMKQLRYRSVESMLKRENISEIFLGAQYLEPASWLKIHSRLISRLEQTAFELRPLKLQTLSYGRWANTADPQTFIAENNSVGALGIWPSEQVKNVPLLSMVVFVVDKLNSYKNIKLGQTTANLSQTVAWWADLDHLVANLSSEHVSLSLKDVALNSLYTLSYSQRELSHAQISFWQELLSRYENLPEAVGDMFGSIAIKPKFDIPEPVYEFAEDI